METTTKKISIDDNKTASKNTYDIKTLNNKIIYLKKKVLLTEAKMIKGGRSQNEIDLLIGSYQKEMKFYIEKREEIKLSIEIDRINKLF